MASGDLVAFGTHFKPRDANHFVASPGAEIIFDRAQNGGTRLTLAFEDAAPQILERFEPLKPSTEDLAQYAGEYTSGELPATYRFAVKDGKLALATNSRARLVWLSFSGAMPRVTSPAATSLPDACEIFHSREQQNSSRRRNSTERTPSR